MMNEFTYGCAENVVMILQIKPMVEMVSSILLKMSEIELETSVLVTSILKKLNRKYTMPL